MTTRDDMLMHGLINVDHIEIGEDAMGRQTYRYVLVSEWKVVPCA